MEEIDILRSEMEVCDMHAERFLLACQKLEHAFPFSLTFLEKIGEDDIGNLDLLTNRFGKLQDTLGRKIFPLILRLSNEDDPQYTFLDRLNKLDKMKLVDDVHFWTQLRKLRNSIAHDYPGDQTLADNMNQCVILGRQLVQQWERVKVYINIHILPFYEGK